MQKILITFCLLLLGVYSWAQQKKTTKVNLVSSSKTVLSKNRDFLKVYNGTFQHENSTLQSDSAYFYPQKNAFDAFGHVVIHQADTLNIYSDLLNYNGNTHIAILTNHVILVDKDATLTTDHLNYNTQTRYGTYAEGGKLTQKENTLVSRNGYYFAFSRDAYFRYNVVLTGKDALVKSDTMRYNSNSKIAYFYGPTHIYQKTDTLYTEFGTYNTITQQALGTKNNRYDSGSRTLVGDTLFFDDIKGFGRANGRIVFNDTEQRINLRGDLANYYKAQERTVVTKNAYVIFVTEQRDSVNRDSLKHPEKYAVKEAPAASAKTSNTKNSTAKTALPKNQPTANTKNSTVKTASPKNQSTANTKNSTAKTALPKNEPAKSSPAKLALAKKPIRTLVKDTVITKRDSIYMTADTLETQILTFKAEKERREKMRLYGLRDTSVKARSRPKLRIKGKNELEAVQLDLRNLQDTTYRHREFFGKMILPKVEKKRAPDTAALRKLRIAQQDSTKKALEKDPVYASRKVVLSDTSRVRNISAWHRAKIFKSDLQAVADSITFSNSDSLVRLYIKPIIWAEGSQLTADTIFLQLKNKKLDNMDLIRSSFVVNTQGDSTYFNQVSGKKIRGIFRNNKLSTLFVDGNAESLYYTYENNQFTNMNHSLSSRIRINLKNNKPSEIVLLSKPDAFITPIARLKDDDKYLKGFIWKPKDRPVSKESIIPGLARKAKKAAPPPKPKTAPPAIVKPVLANQNPLKK